LQRYYIFFKWQKTGFWGAFSRGYADLAQRLDSTKNGIFGTKFAYFSRNFPKNDHFLHFFAKKFAHIKKKQYLCIV